MTAVTTDRDPQLSDGDYAWHNVANGSAIYTGTLVNLNASGLAVPASNSSAQIFVGVALNTVASGTGASAATASASEYQVKVKRSGIALFDYSGTLTQANLGDLVYALNNATVAPVSEATDALEVGTIVEVVSSTTCRVAFGPVGYTF